MALGFTLAEYDSSGYGFAYNGERNKDKKEQNILKQGDIGFIPAIQMGSSDEDSSTTKSAIADGIIVLTKPSEQKQDVTKLNRNTQDTLNKLDKIFDKKEIEEKQELAGLFAELSFNAIHELSATKKDKDGNVIKQGWSEEQKVLAHAAVGYISAELAGSKSSFSTALAAGVNKFVTEEILKDEKALAHYKEHPEELQWLSAALGATIGQMAGDAGSGASIAASGTKNNMFWEYIPEMRKIVEDAIKSDMKDLKPWEVLAISFNGGELITGSDVALILNSPEKDVYSGFAIGAGASMLPASVNISKGHFIDAYGNVVTDVEKIRKNITGYSFAVNASALFGGSSSVGRNFFTLNLKGVETNLSIGVTPLNFMWNVGSLEKGIVPYDFRNIFKNK